MGLFTGDIHELDAATLNGPFDPAFMRAFLLHQAEPARTLGRIAGLVRLGRLDCGARAAG